MERRRRMAGTLRDAVYGAAVGDALGVPYEFRRRGEFACTGMVGGGAHDQLAGTWSDDTSLLLATCDSLRECGGKVRVDDLRRRFCDWMRDGRYTPDGFCFGIGNTTAKALAEGKGCVDVRSNGNGSLMRIAPLVFADASDRDVAEASAVTHAHSVSVDACVAFVHTARDLAAGVPAREAVERNAPEGEEFSRVGRAGELRRCEVESSGYVVHTLEASLWCLLNTDDYAACALAAVNLGDDSDTTACVAGALAGIVYGAESIPQEWLAALRRKDLIEACLF